MAKQSSLSLLFTVLSAGLLLSAAAHHVEVRVRVQYPLSSLPSTNTTLYLMGDNPPLSWTQGLALTPSTTTADEWGLSFTIGGLNSTYPTWTVAMKVMLSDGTWQLGCNDRVTVTVNQTQVEALLWPYFYTTSGLQQTLTNVYSPQLNNSRSVWLYIPPGIQENPYRYERNVNIFQDGQNLAPLWNVPEHLDKHIIDGTMESLFVIGPYNMDGLRLNEYTYVADPNYGGGDGDKYLDFLQDTLLPLVASQFNILTKQENMGILGSSLGGLIACYAGVTRRHIYSKVGCMSSSFWWDYNNFRHTIVPQVTSTHAATQVYYIDSGDSGDTDDGRPETSLVTTLYARVPGFVVGTNLFYYLQRGGHHNEYFWSLRFHYAMQYLYYHDAVWNLGDTG